MPTASVHDVQFTMPPLPLAYQGPELAGRFLRATAFRPGCTATLIPTRANRQPAFGFYIRDPHLGETVTVGLLAIFDVYPDSEQALASFQEQGISAA